MKKPSRLMPKYIRKPTSLISWLVMVALLLGLFFYIYKFPLLLIIFPIIYIAEKVNNKNNKIRISDHFNPILKERENDSICTFSKSFNTKETDTWIIRAVYEQLQNYMQYVTPNFPIKADDHLFNDLWIHDEDLDLDLVEEISQRTGVSLDDYENNPYYGNVTTVRNLVLFFNIQNKIITSRSRATAQ